MKIRRGHRRVLRILARCLLVAFSRCLPARKDLWLFGSWFGERYADNSRALFEYVTREMPSIQAVWLSHDANVVRAVRESGRAAYLATGPKATWLSARASWGFVTSSPTDLNPLLPPRRLMNLWHGIPLKTIMYRDRRFLAARGAVSRRVNWYVERMGRDMRIDICVSSMHEAEVVMDSFRLSPAQVHVTGAPRLDVLHYALTHSHECRSGQMDVLYAPTHRLDGGATPPWLRAQELVRLDQMLDGLGIRMHVRMHYASPLLDCEELANVSLFPYRSSDPDLHSQLAAFDMLVTDYSSIFFDYLLTDRPIIFAAFDLKQYKTQDRAFNFVYEEVTPGPKCEDWDQVVTALVDGQRNPRMYANERRRVRQAFLPLEPGKACERVCRLVTEGNVDAPRATGSRGGLGWLLSHPRVVRANDRG